MVDPITALGLVKTGLGYVGKARSLFEWIANRNTNALIEARDEMVRSWAAETYRLVRAHVEESRARLEELGHSFEEQDIALCHLLEQHETQMLAVIYADAAYREAVDERRRMLSFAAASIARLDLTIEQKASTERVLRSLDPSDILELHKLERIVGKIRRVPEGMAYLYTSSGALRHAALRMSPSDDALCSARCVREDALYTGVGFGGAGGGPSVEAHVTDRGSLVLEVLHNYVGEKLGPFDAYGREHIPGSRSRVEALGPILAAPGLMGALRAFSEARTDNVWKRHVQLYQVQRPTFRPATPAVPKGNDRLPQPLVEMDPTAVSSLHFGAVRPELAKAVPSAHGTGLEISLEELPEYGRPAMNVVLSGPFDILRWLADELDARWV